MITDQSILEDQLHFAKKKEQKVWGEGEHAKARAEVERIEKELQKVLDKNSESVIICAP